MKYKKKKEREKKSTRKKNLLPENSKLHARSRSDSEGEECWRKKTNFRVTRRKEIFQLFTTAVKRLIGRAT